jgi:hypothetical protein
LCGTFVGEDGFFSNDPLQEGRVKDQNPRFDHGNLMQVACRKLDSIVLNSKTPNDKFRSGASKAAHDESDAIDRM